MSQRNPMNERYQDENRTGKTRKSSASAKPKAERAATVRPPAPKTKKQKKQEARERERKEMQKVESVRGRFETTEEYKRLRRIWWVALIGAIVCTALSFFLQSRMSGNGDDSVNFQGFSMAAMVVAYVLIALAFYIDLGKIRKARKKYDAAHLTDKSKAARKEQKKMRAEKREQEKEAAAKFEAAKAEEEAKSAQRGKGLLGRFLKKDEAGADSGAGDSESAAGSKTADSKTADSKSADSKSSDKKGK